LRKKDKLTDKNNDLIKKKTKNKKKKVTSDNQIIRDKLKSLGYM